MHLVQQSLPSDGASAQTEPDARSRFERLFRENSRAVLGYALRRVERSEDAADVVSEVMLIAWRRLDAVPAGDETRLWLYGVARRVIANVARSDRRRARLGDRLRGDVARRGQDDHARAHEAQEAIRAALLLLTPDDRELLLLAGWEGLKPSEIAVVLAMTPSAVRTRLHRARARLRDHLDEGENVRTAAEETP